MSLTQSAKRILKKTSRTFYIPISRLPDGLQESVGAAYLCMRAIDEIEDHARLSKENKIQLLQAVSDVLAKTECVEDLKKLDAILQTHQSSLPEVSLELSTYAMLAPMDVASLIWKATSRMAGRMAHWSNVEWSIQTEEDLNDYTYDVAGSVGLLLTDLWKWHDGTNANAEEAIGFGRGLQAVNILRNRSEDLERGVDFFPRKWANKDMIEYIHRQLDLADQYLEQLPKGPAYSFCQIPLVLAHATLRALKAGCGKLSRDEVFGLVANLTS